MPAASPPETSSATAPSLAGSGARVVTRAGRLGLVLAAQAELLAAATREEAAARLADLLVTRLGFDRVALAFLDGERLGTPVLHGAGRADPSTPLGQRLLAAMHEALDQQQPLVTPAAGDEALSPIRQAQRALIGTGEGLLLTLPLLAPASAVLDTGTKPKLSRSCGTSATTHGHAPSGTLPVAVLCAQRFLPTPPAVAAEEAAVLDHVAAFAAPVLALLTIRDRSARQHVTRWWQAASPRGRRVRQLGLMLGFAALTIALAWPVAWHVGAPAQAEGMAQRVMAAPAAGHLQQVHVRPGDVVREGQVLLEMTDRDLQAERERWTAQLLQAEAAVAEANVRGDRAQLVRQWAKVSGAQAQLDRVDSQLSRIRIVAPFDAVVAQGDWRQNLGAPVAAGAELLTLVPRGPYRVMARVDEADLPLVAVGQSGQLVVSGRPADPLALRVVRITSTAQPREGRHVFDVEAELLAPPSEWRPGLSGHVRLDVGRQPWGLGWLQRGLHPLRSAFGRWWG